MEKNLKITQTKSIIDQTVRQKRTIEALGLGRPNYSVVKKRYASNQRNDRKSETFGKI